MIKINISINLSLELVGMSQRKVLSKKLSTLGGLYGVD